VIQLRTERSGVRISPGAPKTEGPLYGALLFLRPKRSNCAARRAAVRQNALAFWTPEAPFRVKIALRRSESISPGAPKERKGPKGPFFLRPENSNCLYHRSDFCQRSIDLILVINQAWCETRVTIAVRRATHDDALIVHSLNNLVGTDSIDIETHQTG